MHFNVFESMLLDVSYSQIGVFLNFAGLTWPHVSCATLIQEKELPVPASAWD